MFDGPLLAPQFDALFDGGLMNVDETGSVRLSFMFAPAQQQLALPSQMVVHKLQLGH